MASTATVHEAESILTDEALAEENLLEELENEEAPSYIREARLASLKAQAVQFQQMKEHGHGQYSELKEEKGFLDLTTKLDRCVVHFFHPDFRRCDIMDTHLESLSQKFFDVKFAKINVEIAKFFVEKLKVQVLPHLICFKNGVVVDRIVGFDELGNTDNFATEVLERRLHQSGILEVKDVVEERKTVFGFQRKEDSDSDDDHY